MYVEDIKPVEYDEDELLAPDVRDMMEMQVWLSTWNSCNECVIICTLIVHKNSSLNSRKNSRTYSISHISLDEIWFHQYITICQIVHQMYQ